MTRPITAAMITAAESADQNPALFIEALFDSGPLRFWSGLGPISWDGKSWTGAGNMLAVTSAVETTRVVASGAAFVLSGIPSAEIATALGEEYQGRQVTYWLGLLDSAGAVIIDPITAFVGRLDVMTIDEGGDTATLSVTAENRLTDLERAPGGVYTDEDQKARFPTDKGLEFVAVQQDQEVLWR